MRYGIPVSGNDAEAKYLVMNVSTPLATKQSTRAHSTDGRNFEPGSAVYEADLSAEAMQAAIGVK